MARKYMAGQDLRNDDRIRTEYFPWGRFCFTSPQNVTLYNMYID